MPRAYSPDLRARVLAAYDRGMKTRPIADLFGVSASWARRVKQRRRETGETSARRVGSPGIIKVDRARLTQLVREDPDATLEELRDRLGIECAISTICMALQVLGFTRKKRRCAPPNRIDRTWRRVVATGNNGRRRRRSAG